jgi:hypothetical protein
MAAFLIVCLSSLEKKMLRMYIRSAHVEICGLGQVALPPHADLLAEKPVFFLIFSPLSFERAHNKPNSLTPKGTNGRG